MSPLLPRCVFFPGIILILGCGDGSRAPVSGAKARVTEVPPSLKIEIDPGARVIRNARWFESTQVRLFVRSSRENTFQIGLLQQEGQSVFYLNDLPKVRSGDELVVEVWDDQTMTAEQIKKCSDLTAAGIRLAIRVIGIKSYIVAENLAGASEIDVIAHAVASWETSSWKYLGRGVTKVGDNGLPTSTFANPVSIVSDDGRREVLGRMYLFMRPQ